jgi:hypothetical protein
MSSSSDIKELIRRFAALGASDPEAWATSQAEEGIPQLARFLFLRQAWQHVVAEDDPSWIAAEIEAADDDPEAPLSGVGHALKRLKAIGASDADLTDLVRGMQVHILSSLCYLLEDPGLEGEPEAEDISWALCQITEEGAVPVNGLHESVLETDPTGREMRPRPRA